MQVTACVTVMDLAEGRSVQGADQLVQSNEDIVRCKRLICGERRQAEQGGGSSE